MPKRSYNLSFGPGTESDYDISKKSKKIDKEVENIKKDMMSVADMDIFGGNDSITIKDNHIYFYGNVTSKNCMKLNIAIRDMSKKLNHYRIDYGFDDLKINLHIKSYGGCVFSALSTIDTIKSCDVPVKSIIEGCAASAATMISVVCHERVMQPNSYMLIHQLSSGFWGKMEEIKDEFNNLKKLSKKIRQIYKEHTKLRNSYEDEESDMKKLKDVLKKDIWWDADECIKYGLVESVINHMH